MIENKKYEKKYDMKKIATILGIIALVSYSISALIVFASGGKFYNNGKALNINAMKKANITSAKKIVIDVASDDVTILPTRSNTSEATAHLYGTVTSTEKKSMPVLKLTRSGDVLHISIEDETLVHFGYYSRNLKLDVALPESYTNELEISASSSDIKLGRHKLSALKIDVTSGDLSFDTIETGIFRYHSSSGYANIKSLKATSAIFSSTFGDTKIDTLNCISSSFESSSGTLNVNHITGNLKAESTSGDMTIGYTSFHNNIDIDTSSGEVKLTLPSNAKFNLTTDTSSGNVTCDFPITMSGKNNNDDEDLSGSVGSSNNKVQISTTSGDISCLKE